jgi:hypothetical protein
MRCGAHGERETCIWSFSSHNGFSDEMDDHYPQPVAAGMTATVTIAETLGCLVI